ncbi:hypothetical protein BU25DRAFT_105679 [Macroventuria anomochaeta]|uniref:Uncharacterized protein n=1 Tax=Macroventuria anomochaeta TaxID=301207 RepID=A0ACB6RVU6_9PLEO|nr:uncharacterized protein BU25DRAFT_105679 [Macroventuria anomochaeta]KAF2625908.1 hypothetical protein BU25DRAFT_105679 [Macroventuria anomochaeta]
MPTIITAGLDADRQRHLDSPPESRRRSNFASPTPAYSKSPSHPWQPNYSSTFVRQHPFPSLCMRERRITFCNEYHDCELPRHYQRRFRRSDALRFASRARRRNKRLKIRGRLLCSEGQKRGHDLRLRYDHGCHIGYGFAWLSLNTLTFLIWAAWCGSIWKSHGWASSAGLFLRLVPTLFRAEDEASTLDR